MLSVAGSDSGGGAGIQADIKTITMLGGYAACAVTALTAQNTHGVHGIFPVTAEFVGAQMRAVLDDIGADAVKTGMLPNAEIMEAVADALADFSGALVVDPVMVASSGDRLMEANAVAAFKAVLLGRATLVTPNLPEAAWLVGRDVETLDDMKRAADALMQAGAQAVLVKGGHLREGAVVTDVLASAAGFALFENPRLGGAGGAEGAGAFHGTGCTLAAAVATKLAQGATLPNAVQDAIAYTHHAIKTANPQLGTGSGQPLNHSGEA